MIGEQRESAQLTNAKSEHEDSEGHLKGEDEKNLVEHETGCNVNLIHFLCWNKQKAGISSIKALDV